MSVEQRDENPSQSTEQNEAIKDPVPAGKGEKDPAVQPLWPKTADEYGWVCCDLGVIGMVAAGVGGQCPAIGGIKAFLISFAAVTVAAGGLRFWFSLRRPDQDKLYPRVKMLVDFMGIAQLAIGVWGVALIFPNLNYLGDPSPQTCEMGPLIATLIPSCIIAVVVVGLMGMLIMHVSGCQRVKNEDVVADVEKAHSAEGIRSPEETEVADVEKGQSAQGVLSPEDTV